MTALIDLAAVDPRLARTDTVSSLADQIDALLPQTQCTQCGFDGCRPYAEAIAAGAAGIDRCPPGGERGLVRLATLLQRPIVPLDPRYGEHRPRHIAVIDERYCIGCTLCIQACPVDAIVGANKFMHTVLNDACSGCDLCIAPCPVDCISMQPARAWDQGDIDQARQRHQQRNARLSKAPRAARATPPVDPAYTDSCTPGPGGASAAATTGASPTADTATVPAAASATADDTKRDVIAAALARARARRAASPISSTDSAA